MWTRPLQCLVCLVVVAGASAAEKPPLVPEFARGRDNIALGRPYKYNAVPSYRLTRSESDLQDLTDGSLSHRPRQKIWFDRKACAWGSNPHVNIRVDLGQVEPVEAAAISLLGGAEQGSLKFPRRVALLVSTDGRAWARAGVYERVPEGQEDRDPFGVPKEEGVAWTYPLRFTGLRCAARYVGFEIEGQTAFVATDELYVFRGTFAVDEAKAYEPYAGRFVVHEFAPGRIAAYFSKPTVYVSTNVQTYQTLMGSDDRVAPKAPVTLRLDLPEGMKLRRYQINVRYGGAGVDDPPGRSVAVAGKPYTRYEIDTRGIPLRDWGHFFWSADWPDGHRDTLRISAVSAGQEQPWEEYAVEAVRIEPVARPRRLHVSVCWMTEMFWTKWPGCLQAMKTVGMTGMPFFPRYTFRDGRLKDFAAQGLAQARAMGFDVVHNESPIHAVRAKVKDHPEIACQPSQRRRWMCPCYRGKFYQDEVEAIAQRYAALKAGWLIYDCEAFSGYSADVSKKCSRCREEFAKSGMGDWQRFACERGADFYRDVDRRIQGLVPGATYLRGSYGVVSTKIYHNIWDVGVLLPSLHQFTMPSLYRFRPQEVGDPVREQRRLLSSNAILPWLQPGNQGEMPAEHVRCSLLEACLSGARGAVYYTWNGFDAADYRAVSQAIAVLRQVEDVVMDGQPLQGGSCSAGSATVAGLALGDRAVLLVSDYALPDGAVATVTLPSPFTGQAEELTPAGPQPVEVRDAAIRVTFGPLRARVYRLSR